MMNTSHSPVRGYTLLELIVAIGIFSIVMLVATAAYLTMVALDREARASADVVTNLSFAVDSMMREARTGTEYQCNDSTTTPYPNCTSTPGTSFGFTDSRSPTRHVVYWLSPTTHQIMVKVDGVDFPLTDPRINVDTLSFYVRGVGTDSANSETQPNVLVIIHGTLESKGKTTSFSIQGSATQRLIEL